MFIHHTKMKSNSFSDKCYDMYPIGAAWFDSSNNSQADYLRRRLSDGVATKFLAQKLYSHVARA